MTPPKIDKVDIKALSSLYLEHLVGLNPQELSAKLKGSDLNVDLRTAALRRLVGGKGTELRGLPEEIAWIQVLRESDKNGDGILTLEEARAVLAKHLAKEQAAQVDPERFLGSVEALMKNRYRPISENMKLWRAELGFLPTLDALKLYNQGLLIEDTRQANSVFPLNALHKTVGNAVAWIPVNLLWRPVRFLWGKARSLSQESMSWLVCDAAAERSAKARHLARSQAIQKLEGVVQEGIRKGEAWALNGDFAAALKKLQGSDPVAVAILDRELGASRLHPILSTPDPKERFQKLMDFAKTERPGFLGFGTGNTRRVHLWNYTGSRNNLFFTRTVFKFLGSKASTENAEQDKILHSEARSNRKDMLGDGGGFGNLFGVGFTQLTSLFGKLYKPAPYRSWGDEGRLEAVGRSIDIGLMLYGGAKLWDGLGEARALRRLKGWKGVKESWTNARATAAEAGDKRPWNPTPIWRDARIAAEKKVEVLQPTGAWGRFKQRVADGIQAKLFKGLPPLTAEQQAGMKTMRHRAGGFIGKLTKGVVLTGIAGFADKKLQAYYNPFELNHEAQFDRYPDPTKPDPGRTQPPVPARPKAPGRNLRFIPTIKILPSPRLNSKLPVTESKNRNGIPPTRGVP